MSPAIQPREPLAAVRSRRWVGLALLTLALFMASMDNTILNVALPTLARELGATNDQLQWTVDSYQVAYAGCLLIAGSLVDRWGKTRTFLAGVLMFGLCSLIASMSINATMLIWARGLTGIGAALLTPSTLAMVSTLFHHPKERTTAFAIWSAANGAGAGVGPLLSGLLLEHFHWGSIFLINVPIAVIVLGFGSWLLPGGRGLKTVNKTDWIGAISSTLALCLICWSVISAPSLGMHNPLVVSSVIAGASLLAGFIWLESRYSAPILHLGLFRNRRFSVAVAVSGLVTAGGAGALFVLSQYLQFTLKYSPWETGVRIIPIALALLGGALSATWVIHQFGLKHTVVIGLFTVTIGFVWLALTSITSTYLELLPGGLLFGLGAGVLMPAATQAVMDALPADASGVGSATNSALMQVGSALGVAVIGSLLAGRFRAAVSHSSTFDVLASSEQSRVLDSMASALHVAAELPGEAGRLLAQDAQRGFVHGMQTGLSTSAAAVLVATIAVIVLYPPDSSAPRKGAQDFDDQGL